MNLIEETVGIPSSVSAYGWVPFAVAILLSVMFSFFYVSHLWSKSERRRDPAIVATLGLSVAMLSAILLPVDVFLVSSMKNDDGTFKEWATNATRHSIENSVAYTYYTLYGIILVYAFFILPLAYFMYEERDEEHRTVLPTALLYTLVFLLLIAGLLIAGVFIPFKGVPPQNSTDWNKIKFMIEELYRNRGEDALAFVINVLTVYGMLNLIIYTSTGLASFPLTMIRGFRSLSDEATIIGNSQVNIQSKINALRSKQSHKTLTNSEVSALADLEEEESLLQRRSQLLESQRHGACSKCGPLLRVLDVLLGLIGVAFSILLLVSLFIANLDKLINSMGHDMGYILKNGKILNPLDYIMVNAQKIFPMDYILFFSLIVFLLICSVSGIRYLGVCCFGVPMYKIRAGRSPPQGLLMFTFILVFIVFAFHVLMFAVIPSYITFGHQSYCAGPNSSACNVTRCSLDAPPDQCVMTRAAAFALGFTYKASMFAAAYYWMSWVFIGAFAMSALIIIIRNRKSALEEAIDRDDFDDSYDDPVVRI